jgi:hypothetical protein
MSLGEMLFGVIRNGYNGNLAPGRRNRDVRYSLKGKKGWMHSSVIGGKLVTYYLSDDNRYVLDVLSPGGYMSRGKIDRYIDSDRDGKLDKAYEINFWECNPGEAKMVVPFHFYDDKNKTYALADGWNQKNAHEEVWVSRQDEFESYLDRILGQRLADPSLMEKVRVGADLA